MKRLVYLIVVALAVMLILTPAALAQNAGPGDDDPLAPEQNVVVLEEDALEQTVGKRLPEHIPDGPIDEPGAPAPKGGTLPKSGGVMTPSALLLPAAALLLGSSILGCAVYSRRK